MLEEERKYEVDDDFVLPELSGALTAGGRVRPLPPQTLTASYFDADDRRLARSGVSLRHRRGDPRAWTVKLPTDATGVRREISRGGAADRIPAELAALVTVFSRGADLAPAAVVRTVRYAYELRDAEDRVLVEVADDAVSVLCADAADTAPTGTGNRPAPTDAVVVAGSGCELADEAVSAPTADVVRATFREIEVERKAGDRELVDRIEAILRAAGAVRGRFVPKQVRALGAAALAEPDLVPPAELPATPTAGDVVTTAIRRGVGRLLTHDPLVRLRAPVGDDDSAVHQMRVACRRLRSDLRTFGPLLHSEWAEPLRRELKWLADALGPARDAEVLRARLRRTAEADPLCPLDEPAVARLDAVLAERHDRALAAVDEALRADRYVALVETLVSATRSPRLTALADSSAAAVLPRLVSRPWRRLATRGKSSDGATDLDPAAPDERWHAVRVNGKKARYAVEAVAPALGGGAARLARSLARVQDLLGEHQDAAVGARTWLSLARHDPADHTLAVTAGRLFERERAAIRTVRADFPAVWRRAARRRATKWLP